MRECVSECRRRSCPPRQVHFYDNKAHGVSLPDKKIGHRNGAFPTAVRCQGGNGRDIPNPITMLLVHLLPAKKNADAIPYAPIYDCPATNS